MNATTTPRGLAQCDGHRRAAEQVACEIAARQERQSVLNRAEWLRRAKAHDAQSIVETDTARRYATGGYHRMYETHRDESTRHHNIAFNIRAKVRDTDARPGHSH